MSFQIILVFSQFLVVSIKIIKVYTDTLFYILHQSRIRVPDQIQVLVFGMYFSYFKCLANRNNIATWQRCNLINVRKHIRGNKKRTIQRKWPYSVHKRKKNKTKSQHNMRWTPLFGTKHKTKKNTTQHNTKKGCWALRLSLRKK